MQSADNNFLKRYDRKEVIAMRLIDMTLIAAMGLSGNHMTPRFVRHFNVIGIDEFDDSVMTTIFGKIMLWHLDTR